MEGVLVIKNLPVKQFSFYNGGIICCQERVCQTLHLLQWRVYWWSRSRLSNSSTSSMESVLIIKNLPVKLFSFTNGGTIGDQERVCQTLQLLQWSGYWWSKLVCQIFQLLQGGGGGGGVLVMKDFSVKLFRFSVEAVLVIKNVSVKLFSFINGGSIGDEERVCQTLQFLQWRQYWWPGTCLSNSSASSMEGVLVMKNVPVKLFSFFIGGSIADQERVCQTLHLH